MSEKREKVGKLLRQCGVGNKLACAAAKLHVIEAGSVVTFRNVDAQDSDHPNRMPFKGILLLTDQASTKPPHGSQGHRIFVPTNVAQKKLRGLIGMGINYDAVDLDGHSTRHKVGVVTKAWIEGTKVKVEGFIYKKDFPEAVDDLKDRSDLGMSMELADVYVRDEHESVWHLLDFEFTGATILKKDAAAYYQTALAASKQIAAAGSGKKRRPEMAEEKKKEKSVAAAAGESSNIALLQQAIGSAVRDALAPVQGDIKAMAAKLDKTTEDVDELRGLYVIEAAAKKHDDDEDEDEEIDMEAKSDDDDDMEARGHEDDEDMEAKSDDDDEDEEMSAALEDLEEESAEEEPGEVNKKRGDKNKGNKSSVTDPPIQGEKVPGNIAKGRLKSAGFGAKPFPGVKGGAIQAAAVQIQTLVARAEKANKMARRAMQAAAEQAKENKKMKLLVRKMEAQVQKAANDVNRRSVLPVEVRNLLAKGGVDSYQLQASGQKLSTEGMDNVFATAASQGVILEPEQRATMKNIMYQKGLLESGEIDRGYTN